MIKFKLNPITRKRLQRFRRFRRAYVALWALIILYAVSLAAELICNDKPYYLRCRGNSYFPILSSYQIPVLSAILTKLKVYPGTYPQDEFLSDGILTPPNYKELDRHRVFTDSPGNYMIFAPVPHGKYEVVDSATIPVPDDVTVEFVPVARLASVDLRQDLTIVQSTGFAFFFGTQRETSERDVRGKKLTGRWPLPASLTQAIGRRFANHNAPEITVSVKRDDGKPAVVSLRAYRQRSRVPRKVRLRFEEPPPSSDQIGRLVFSRDLKIAAGSSTLAWQQAKAGDKQRILAQVKERFKKVLDPSFETIGGVNYQVLYEREDVNYPFRPITGHLLGIDENGRDVFARLLYGLRISLNFGFILVTVTYTIGIAIGAVQGYFGGKLDISTQRLIEIWSSLPFLYIIILLGSIYTRGFMLLLFIYAIFNWIGISMYMRAEFLRLRKQPFIEAARCLGLPHWKIIFKHILPNSLVPVITFFPFAFVAAIFGLSALDYLGYGLPPPQPSWGELLNHAQNNPTAWWLTLYPFLALFSVILLCVLIGEGVRTAFDPKQFSRIE